MVERGLAETTAKAHALILAGKVRAPGLAQITAGAQVFPDQPLERVESLPFVSRGGLKLQAAIKQFGVEVKGRVCVDIGASTGGFTDCLLQAGALKVLAVDVGHGQLHWKLRNDPRVENREKQHVLDLRQEDIQNFGAGAEGPLLVTVDVSFISLKKVFPHLSALFGSGTELVVLVKPQFEVGPKEVPKGVVRDAAVHERVRKEMAQEMLTSGLERPEEMESPLTGPSGNIEFLFYSRVK